ncbi:hypothetical protein [Galbibacter sp.]|nr:hypothetical protein [Galbibacter sp.]HLV62673.1 hypothetical protein [Galbibacter sp.]
MNPQEMRTVMGGTGYGKKKNRSQQILLIMGIMEMKEVVKALETFG